MRYIKLLITLTLFVYISSCVKHTNMVLMNDELASKNQTIKVSEPEAYRIQKRDLLDISVASTDVSSVSIFTKAAGQGGLANVSEQSNYLRGYIVDDSGRVSMPMIGDIEVQGLTIEEIKAKIQTHINSYFKFAVVDVKLLSFRISVLGEVKKQGASVIYRGRINLLEAIAMSGGFTDVSRKDNVKIIRQKEGESEVTIVDFTDPNLLTSEVYYLTPNDIIYVEPLKAKKLKVNGTAISIVLSSITTLILTLNFVNNQIIKK